MLRWCVLLLTLAAPLALAAPPAVQVMTAQVPAWPEPTVAVWHGSNAYVFQGERVLRYDPVRDVLTTLAPQAAFHGATAGFSDGQAIHLLAYEGVAGACATGGVPLRLFRYDPTTGQVGAGPDVAAARPQILPLGRVLADPCAPKEWAPALAWDGRHAYLLGGRECATPCNVLRYDPATERLVPLGGSLPFLTTRYAGAAAATAGSVYLFGGTDPRGGAPPDERPQASVLRYDAATDGVTSLPPMPMALAWATAAVDGGRICIMGGDAGVPGASAPQRTVLRYDPAAGTYEVFEPLPHRLHATAAASDGSHLYLFGGLGDGATARPEVVRVDCDGQGRATLPPPTTPVPTPTPTAPPPMPRLPTAPATDGAGPAAADEAVAQPAEACEDPACAPAAAVVPKALPVQDLSHGAQSDHDCASEGQLLFRRPCDVDPWVAGRPIVEERTPTAPVPAPAPPMPAAAPATLAVPPLAWLLFPVLLLLAAVLWRLRHWWPAALPLFSRVRPDQVSSHPARARILRLVTERPGIHFTALLHALGTGRGGLRHHLTVLLSANLLAEESRNGRRHYYLRQVPPEVRRAVAALTHPSARRVLQAARADAGPSISEVARDAGLSRRAVRAHLLRLEEAGLVRLHRMEGRTLVQATAAVDL